MNILDNIQQLIGRVFKKKKKIINKIPRWRVNFRTLFFFLNINFLNEVISLIQRFGQKWFRPKLVDLMFWRRKKFHNLFWLEIFRLQLFFWTGKTLITKILWRRHWRSSCLPFRRPTENDVSGHFFRHNFISPPPCFTTYFTPFIFCVLFSQCGS